jgi:glycogen operon protein
VTLPTVPGLTAYRLLWDSAWERPQEVDSDVEPGAVTVDAMSIRAYAANDPT